MRRLLKAVLSPKIRGQFDEVAKSSRPNFRGVGEPIFPIDILTGGAEIRDDANHSDTGTGDLPANRRRHLPPTMIVSMLAFLDEHCISFDFLSNRSGWHLHCGSENDSRQSFGFIPRHCCSGRYNEENRIKVIMASTVTNPVSSDTEKTLLPTQ